MPHCGCHHAGWHHCHWCCCHSLTMATLIIGLITAPLLLASFAILPCTIGTSVHHHGTLCPTIHVSCLSSDSHPTWFFPKLDPPSCLTLSLFGISHQCYKHHLTGWLSSQHFHLLWSGSFQCTSIPPTTSEHALHQHSKCSCWRVGVPSSCSAGWQGRPTPSRSGSFYCRFAASDRSIWPVEPLCQVELWLHFTDIWCGLQVLDACLDGHKGCLNLYPAFTWHTCEGCCSLSHIGNSVGGDNVWRTAIELLYWGAGTPDLNALQQCIEDGVLKLSDDMDASEATRWVCLGILLHSHREGSQEIHICIVVGPPVNDPLRGKWTTAWGACSARNSHVRHSIFPSYNIVRVCHWQVADPKEVQWQCCTENEGGFISKFLLCSCVLWSTESTRSARSTLATPRADALLLSTPRSALVTQTILFILPLVWLEPCTTQHHVKLL